MSGVRLAEIVLAYARALIWPALLLTFVMAFRVAIRHLINDRLTQIDAAGVSAKFERVAKDAEQVVAANRPPHAASSRPAVDLGTVRTLTLHTFTDARQLGETYRSGQSVILNLHEMSDSDARRLVDFSAGMIFNAKGTIERIADKRFLLGHGEPDPPPVAPGHPAGPYGTGTRRAPR